MLLENRTWKSFPRTPRFQAPSMTSGAWSGLAGTGSSPPDHWPVQRGDNWVQMTYLYQLPTTPAVSCSLSFRVFADGTVETTLSSDGPKVLGPAPEFGVMLKMDADFHRLRWYGPGPEATYWDRQSGGKLGVWETTAEAGLAPYLKPQECGNHASVRWAAVTDGDGLGLKFEGDHMNFSALPWTPSELENAAHPHELPAVHHTTQSRRAGGWAVPPPGGRLWHEAAPMPPAGWAPPPPVWRGYAGWWGW